MALTKLLIQSATVDVDERDKGGKLTGRTFQEPAFSHGITNTYDEKGKGYWKKFGMVTMHPAVMTKLSDTEVSLATVWTG